ncbi:MAG: hypothetical protein LC667_08640 [Thioalkalivibrio sp.]|nr:hypothetical protein [Thioalkalivibrio sp.]
MAEARTSVRGRSIDGHWPKDSADSSSALQATAPTLDVVLDEKAASGPEPERQYRAGQAWSTVVGKRPKAVWSALPRCALTTMVLLVSADGRADLDDLEPVVEFDAPIAKAQSRPAPCRRAAATAVNPAKPSQTAVVSAQRGALAWAD